MMILSDYYKLEIILLWKLGIYDVNVDIDGLAEEWLLDF